MHRTLPIAPAHEQSNYKLLQVGMTRIEYQDWKTISRIGSPKIFGIGARVSFAPFPVWRDSNTR